ncbi:heme oxygenase [Rhodovarius crocodyli]|uniref:Heme oxygenase n=1 Tax=Rhodovarius crocodyli TaxID=1979269 RepID=A0A437MJU4_9PROT|nr:biliverdin-producing heme oxygenase [Rhodovarius crocodyli]RVT97876.1 heme oxygenase [Rhodovarius crocodyli]
MSGTAPQTGLRQALRSGTRDAHARLDSALPALAFHDPRLYAAFLRWHAAIVPPLERALEQAGIARLIPDWAERRRRDALLADLRALGAACPPAAWIPAPTGDSAMVGTAYVLEGSRLGGAALARTVAASLRPAATAYLEHGAGERLWPRFVEIIDTLPGICAAEAAAAANRTFALFEAAMPAFGPVLPAQAEP